MALELCRDRAAPNSTCYVYDHNGELCPSLGEHDYRRNLSACLQYREQWCWATTVVIMANYYAPTKNPIIGGDNCRGLTCKVVGSKVAPHNPSACCEDKDSCGHVDGRPHDITRGLERLTGLRFRVWFTSLAEHGLAAMLRWGGPLAVGVGWSSGGGHIMVVGGTDGRGGFFLHDPLNTRGEGSFQLLTYQQLLAYHPPYGSSVGHWRETYALHGLGNCGTAGFEPQWREYCEAPNPKAWAYKDDCTTFRWRWGGRSPVATALRNCGGGCFTYDRDGKLCGLEGTHIMG